MANFFNPYGYPYQNYQPNYTQTIQNGGVVNVQSEQEARYYPVAPATTVIFDNAKEACIYKKTVGNSTEAPNFEIYKRVESEIAKEKENKANDLNYVEKGEFEALKAEFKALKKELNGDDE